MPEIRKSLIYLVPLAGLEPARCFHHLILSQARLPIPPQGHGARIIPAVRTGSTSEMGRCEARMQGHAASGRRSMARRGIASMSAQLPA
jgi:hypothetical protein